MKVRGTLSCVLMMTLLLCGCGGEKGDDPRQLAAVIRGEYLSMTAWSATARLQAAYGEEVFAFTLTARWEKEGETVITVVEPQLLAGITARIHKGETVLEYDGAGLSLGLLDGEGLTPVSLLPALMDCVATGYMARCDWSGEGEGRLLAVLCREPNAPAEQGVEHTLYFDPVTHALRRAEVSVDGALRLTAELTDFTMEMSDNGAGTDENVG